MRGGSIIPDRERRCVILGGQIASGKTTVAAGVASRCGLHHVRVRQVLMDVLGGSEWGRAELQREGALLDLRTDGRWLWTYIEERDWIRQGVVIDSGRTWRQVRPILREVDRACLICLAASEDVRRARYARATVADAVKASAPFDEAMGHETELAATRLCRRADLSISTDHIDADGVIARVMDYLRAD